MRAICLTCLAAVMLTGCQDDSTMLSEAKTEVTQTSTTTATPAVERAINLDPAALEKLNSWDDTSKASAALTDQLSDTVDEVNDADSAQRAISKLQALSKGFHAISLAEKKMGDPTGEQQGLVLRNLSQANTRFGAIYSKLTKNEDLYKLIGNAVDQAYVGDPVEVE